MSRAKAKFVEADIRRVLVAARKAQVDVCVEISVDGKITVATRPPSGEAGRNPWDEVIDGAAADQKRAP
jgi:hypothetical protein